METYLLRLSVILSSRVVAWAIIGFGVVLRIVQYLHNRSLWFDEAALALNLVNRSYLQLLKPLDNGQGAPILFLWIERLFLDLFGNSEYGLRLFPLLAGILSLYLFYRVSQYCLTPYLTLVALSLFAVLPPLIYYASEVKQYSSDVMVALGLLLMAFQVWSKGLNLQRTLLLGFLGGAALWLSHPALFVVGGIGVSLGLKYASERNHSHIKKLMLAGFIWLVSFALLYLVSLRDLGSNSYLQDFWQNSFVPLSPFSITGLVIWFVSRFFELFKHPVGFEVGQALAAFAFLIGGIALFQANRWKLLVLLLPLFFTIIASAFQKYPLVGRLMLFYVPFVLLLVAVGIGYLWERTRTGMFSYTGLMLLGLLFLQPLMAVAGHITEPHITPVSSGNEDMRPVVAYMEAHFQPGDTVYVYHGGEYAFRYYAQRSGFNNSFIIGAGYSKDDLTVYTRDLEQLQGKQRVWVIFCNIFIWDGFDEKKFFLNDLHTLGQQRDSFESGSASIFLFDLSSGQQAST